MNLKSCLYAFFLILLANTTYSQEDQSSSLYQTILRQDSLLFTEGFNKCNSDQINKLTSDDLEFYHDQTGITKSKDSFISSIENGICNLEYTAYRKLDSRSTELFPLMDNGVIYGAIQQGIHSFYAVDSTQHHKLTSTAKFTHLWLVKNDTWKLARVLSYDHKTIEASTDKSQLFVDKLVTESWLKELNTTGLGIGYITDGKIQEISVFGELELNRKAPLNTIWNVASLTKPIITLTTLKLVNNGNWNLDEPIYHYWVDPDLKDDVRHQKLTTRHILSHQTGFPNWRWDDPDANNKLMFQFDPGTGYQYSGEGFEYLRIALEKKFNKSIEQLVDSLIFQPLKMNDTHFYWNEEINEERFAKWHSPQGEQYATYKNTSPTAADDLLTTVEDYSKFICHILTGAGLSPQLQNEMKKNHVRISSHKYWGLGFWIDENINKNGDYAFVHGGDDIGVHTIVFILPQTKKALIIFTNNDNGTQTYPEVVLHYLDKEGQGIMNAEMQ